MQIVCLANSRKLKGRCISGKQWGSGKAAGSWIRPVSERENQEVSEDERQYEDGSDPRVLDTMEVPMLAPKPGGCQTENWILDPADFRRRIGVHSPLDLSALVDPGSRFGSTATAPIMDATTGILSRRAERQPVPCG